MLQPPFDSPFHYSLPQFHPSPRALIKQETFIWLNNADCSGTCCGGPISIHTILAIRWSQTIKAAQLNDALRMKNKISGGLLKFLITPTHFVTSADAQSIFLLVKYYCHWFTRENWFGEPRRVFTSSADHSNISVFTGDNRRRIYAGHRWHPTPFITVILKSDEEFKFEICYTG